VRARLAVAAVAFLLTAGAALAAPGDPQHDLKPADQAYARSLVLPSTDLPTGSWASRPSNFSGANPPCQVAHYDLSSLTVNGEAGMQYARSGLLIESDARVFATAAQAARAFALTTSTGFARCELTELATSVRGATPLTIGRRFPSGVRAAGARAALGVHSTRGNVTVEATIAALVRGRALATLLILSPSPPQYLSSLLAKSAPRLTKP
jgi:hypothetical protein